jgi:hypothetical protein
MSEDWKERAEKRVDSRINAFKSRPFYYILLPKDQEWIANIISREIMRAEKAEAELAEMTMKAESLDRAFDRQVAFTMTVQAKLLELREALEMIASTRYLGGEPEPDVQYLIDQAKEALRSPAEKHCNCKEQTSGQDCSKHDKEKES